GIPKITDFGAAKIMCETTNHRNGVMGAVAYLDPKRLEKDSYKFQKSSDIYSLGVIFWQISHGKKPFKDEYDKKLLGQLRDKILKGCREITTENIPVKYVKLYEACWQFNPQLRPSIAEVLDELEEY
ncbi:24187_t:CDS:1, partial [Dentiscutata erythropus]